MAKREKARLLLLVGVAFVLTIVISSGLPGVELGPGRPFSLGRQSAISPEEGVFYPGGGEVIVLVLRAILALALILFPLYILFSLLTPEGRQRLVADLIVLSFILLGADLLARFRRQPESLPSAPNTGTELNFPSGPTGPTEVFNPQPSPWFIPLLTILLALALAGLITYIYWVYTTRRSTLQKTHALSQLAAKAQNAVEEIQSGLDLKDTVIRCYYQMSQVLYEERGIERKDAMTPREFEHILTNKGVPEEPVRNLTRLFEEVRYGSKRPGNQEERIAMNSLEAIIEALKGQNRISSIT